MKKAFAVMSVLVGLCFCVPQPEPEPKLPTAPVQGLIETSKIDKFYKEVEKTG